MASEKTVSVFEKSTKKQKGIPVTFFKSIKTDGTPEGAKKAIANLKKNRSDEFEVRHLDTGAKTVYKRLINSASYEVKTY